MKKIIALLTVIALIFVMVAACNGGDDPAPAPAPTPEATTPEATPEPVDDDDEDEPEPEPEDLVDFGGREFVIFTWMPGPETFDPDPAIEDPDSDDIGAWDNLQRIWEDFNGSVRYDIAAHEDIYALFVANMLAGAPPGDLVHIPRENLVSAVAGGFLQAAEDIVPADDPFWSTRNTWWTQPTANVGERHYGFAETNTPYPWSMTYNKNLMLEAGLEDPGLIYDRGGWTWEVFTEHLRALMKVDSDGVPTQWGLSGPPSQILRLMLASNDGAMINTHDFSIGLDNPNSQRAFEFFDQIVVQEQLAKPFVDDWSDMITYDEGDVGFWVNEHWLIWVAGNLHNDPDIATAGVPFPRGPNNHSGYTHFININTGIAVPTGVADPLECYQMWFEMATGWRVMSIEAMESETGYATLEQFFVATSTYVTDTLFGDTEADGQRMLYAWTNLGKLDWGMAMSILGYDDVRRLADGEVTTAQFIEEMRPEIQDQLDEMFGAMR